MRLNSVYLSAVALFFCLCTFIRLHIKNVLKRLIFVLFFYFQNIFTNIQ